MPLDAAQLGFERTMDALRKLLADHFSMTAPGGLSADDPLFAIGVGLTSLEGIEFLCEVEKQFGLHIKDLDWWVYETPTLGAVANYLIELTGKQHATPQA
jgi:acyl carrier protein